MRIVLSILLVLALFGTAVAAPPTADSLNEVQKTFHYGGKPIHPTIIKQFEPWLSDSLSSTVSMDLGAAMGSNQYDQDDVSEGKDHVITAKLPNYHTYAYQFDGMLENGLDIVRTWSRSNTGTGVFENLYVLRASNATGYTADGKPYPRLLLTVVRAFPLGDRASVTVQLKKNRIKLRIKAFQSGHVTETELDTTGE